MTHKNKNISGNGLMVALAIVALVALAVGGWMYVKKPQMDALPDATEITEAQSETLQADEPEIATDETGNVVPSTEVAPAEEATAVDSGPVKIDVAKATGVRALGNPNAPIKIIEYASLTCSHCAHFHNDVLPELKTKYIDTGKVYLEFREFPLNDPALKATLTARCLPEDKYESFVSLLFKTQDHWAGGLDYMAALKQNAKLAGMSDATFEACQAEPALKVKIAENMQQATDKWEINATPTFIINDGAEKISGAQPITEFERLFRKITNNAVGEAPAVE